MNILGLISQLIGIKTLRLTERIAEIAKRLEMKKKEKVQADQKRQ